MKSNIFRDVLEEITLEVDGSKEQTIARLRQQAGFCKETDSDGDYLLFCCTKKGKIGFCTQHHDANRPRGDVYPIADRMYSVQGKVLSENGKTVIKLYSIYSRLSWVFRFLYIAFSILVLISFFIYSAVSKEPVDPKSFGEAVLLLILTAVFSFVLINEKDNRMSDLDLMKREVIDRVEALKRWDE